MDEMDRIDLNQADEDELEHAIDGLGAVWARAIVEEREAHGPFRSLADLDRVAGLDDWLRRRIEAVSTVGHERRTHAPPP